MRQSFLFTKIKRESPHQEDAKNADLLLRAGYINKTMSGVYEFLPLGLKALNKIIDVIREEMNKIGGQEVLMSALQSKQVWEASDRWGGDAREIWFYTNLNAGGEIGLGWTHEEPITLMMKHNVSSYRDLPKYLFQFQTKFRNEIRAKSGILRTREFIMKDLYSFSKDKKEHNLFYEKCADAYVNIFNRIGIGEFTFRTYASGGAFSNFSDEFQTITDIGEDVIYINRDKNIAVNKEVYTDVVLKELGLKKESMEECKSTEVGNIFTLGTRFSEAFDLSYKDKEGKDKFVFMGSYGIGPARLLGVAVELFSNEKALLLPKNIAPYMIHLLNLNTDNAEATEYADTVYNYLLEKKIEVLFDDTDILPGEKLSKSDLLGMPIRVIVSKKNFEQGKIEIIDRLKKTNNLINLEDISKFL